jgi:hypothetical protein
MGRSVVLTAQTNGLSIKIPTKIWGIQERAGKGFFGLLNLFKQLKNTYGANEKSANESG